MEMEAAALRAEVDNKNEDILVLTRSHQEAKDQILELKQELENNASEMCSIHTYLWSERT
jgi:hypothetical protein